MTAATGATREAARAWLVEHLGADGRWHAAADVKAAGARVGHSSATLQGVASDCCERERRAGHFAFWRLPPHRRKSTWISPVLDAGGAT
jgi:hypothetical protein